MMHISRRLECSANSTQRTQDLEPAVVWAHQSVQQYHVGQPHPQRSSERFEEQDYGSGIGR
jgi:hypothetical protein